MSQTCAGGRAWFTLRNNYYGQLGLGDTLDHGDQPGEMGAALPPVDLDM